ncbi:hypothetical protein FIBSPDRAFT_956600 [Athelia psychrophila]|uniref:Uncharacterized protein n=1 Tax=Athelia psychrophila TaxID=1759441 RepID=A0A166GP97_9AGAM|nr:hypothetical protein FIBSPDRAFT_956600 [Fibularhizoctonia sp. CBS 109695]
MSATRNSESNQVQENGRSIRGRNSAETVASLSLSPNRNRNHILAETETENHITPPPHRGGRAGADADSDGGEGDGDGDGGEWAGEESLASIDMRVIPPASPETAPILSARPRMRMRTHQRRPQTESSGNAYTPTQQVIPSTSLSVSNSTSTPDEAQQVPFRMRAAQSKSERHAGVGAAESAASIWVRF